jgi:signal peptidase II
MSLRVRGRVALLLIVLATVGCDRVTKHVATTMLAGAPARSYLGSTVRFEFAQNTGGFLSLGADWPPAVRTGFFTVATGLMLAVFAVYAIRQKWDRWTACGITLYLAGGASNLIDRAVHGSVVDFLNLGIGSVRTGVFNVADVALMLGGALFVAGEFRSRRRVRQ